MGQMMANFCFNLAQMDGDSLDFAPYNDAATANKGHVEMCEKWALKFAED